MPSAYLPMVGGVEELSRHLARHLVLAGDEVEVWTPLPHGGGADETEVEGVPVRRFPMPLPSARVGALARFPAAGASALAALLRAGRQVRPDVVHVQCFSVNGAYATVLSRLAGVPLVVSLQGETVMDDADIFEHSLSLRSALRIGLRRAAAVTGCSQFVLDDASARFGLAPGAGEVVFNGVELSENDARAVELPFERSVACLGRLVEKKGFDLLLRALPAVARDHPGVGLVIGGSGPYRGRLEEQARSLGMATLVHFTGPLDREQVNGLLRQAEVFVMPSRVEPFGIVVLEAWRAGCPVVATSIGGAGEFVRSGHDGMVCDPTDTAGLAAVVSQLLGDASLRARLVANGSTRVPEFDWSVVAGRYRDIYEQVSASAAAPRRKQ